MKLNERHAWFRLFVHLYYDFTVFLSTTCTLSSPGAARRIASTVTTLMAGEVNEGERENT